jgi:DNA processing protein
MKNMNNNDIYTLSQIKGVGNKSLINLVNSGHSIDKLVLLDDDQLGGLIKGSGKKNAIDVIKNSYDNQLDKSKLDLLDLKNNNIDIVTYWDDEYPTLYKAIKNPPAILYCKGDTSLLNKQSVAVVGTRKCSDYGKKIAFKTSMELASKEYVIVSGLALGIDTSAHKGAIEAKGKTIAVLIDVHNISPKKNILLSKKILDTGGLIIAENAPGIVQNQGLFVARDRLQSGLSLAVFSIETAIDGGTMHTAKFAKEQNRLLYCPDIHSIANYPLDSSIAGGTIKLIEDGKAEVYNNSNYAELINTLKLKKSELDEGNNSRNQDDLF